MSRISNENNKTIINFTKLDGHDSRNIYMDMHIDIDNRHMRNSASLIIRDMPITTKVRSCFTPARVGIALNILLATVWAMETLMYRQQVKMACPLCEQHGSCWKHFRESSYDLAIPLLVVSPVALGMEIGHLCTPVLITLVLKIKAKGTVRGKAPVAEYLPSLYETMGSNPRITQKVKNRRKIKSSTNQYGEYSRILFGL